MDEDFSIVVTGVGTGEAQPDRVRAHLGVSTIAPSIAEALAAAAAAQQTVTDIALESGMPRTSIQTSGYRAGRDYESPRGPTRYRVDASLLINFPDLGQTGELLAAMGASVGDAFQIHSVVPETSNTEPLRSTARAAAVASARAKAEELAAAAGVRLGRLRALTEGASPRFGIANGARLMAASAAMDSAPDVEGGELAVRVVVTAVYEITQ